VRGSDLLDAQCGDTVIISAHDAHRDTSGATGGRAMVVTPPALESYLGEIARQLHTAPVSLETEFAVAAKYGQEFLDRNGHWGTIAAHSLLPASRTFVTTLFGVGMRLRYRRHTSIRVASKSNHANNKYARVSSGNCAHPALLIGSTSLLSRRRLSRFVVRARRQDMCV
jgi:hypothetical protein